MAGELSVGEDSVGHEAELVDAAVDAEVDLRLPLWNPKLQDRSREEISTHPGAHDQAAIDLDEQHRLALPNGAKPKKSGYGLSLPLVMLCGRVRHGPSWTGSGRPSVSGTCPTPAARWD